MVFALWFRLSIFSIRQYIYFDRSHFFCQIKNKEKIREKNKCLYVNIQKWFLFVYTFIAVYICRSKNVAFQIIAFITFSVIKTRTMIFFTKNSAYDKWKRNSCIQSSDYHAFNHRKCLSIIIHFSGIPCDNLVYVRWFKMNLRRMRMLFTNNCLIT